MADRGISSQRAWEASWLVTTGHYVSVFEDAVRQTVPSPRDAETLKSINISLQHVRASSERLLKMCLLDAKKDGVSGRAIELARRYLRMVHERQ